MKTYVHWMVAAIFSMTLAFAAPEQGRGTLPAAKGAIAGDSKRVVLPGNISHYIYDVRVGPGQFDVIRLHRVVKELTLGQPVRAMNGVFLLPGTPNYFETVFMAPLISQAVPWDHSIAVFLAKNDVDVWGMDYGWALAPPETTDFTFMKDWGLAKDVQHAEIALSIIRFLRAWSGQDYGPLHLLGLCSGGIIAYAVAGDDTQKPPGLRHVKGIIPLEVGMKLDKEADRGFYRDAIATDQAILSSGVYSDDFGLFLNQLSGLALSAPKDPSDMIPGITNYQAALFVGTTTELVSGQFWHFVGGYLDENGIPSGLRYTEARLWLDVLQNLPPHYPTRIDVDVVFSGQPDASFDGHLGQVAVPILYVGGAGGFGTSGYHATTLTASKDVKTILVQRQPDDKRQEDFGHVDTLLANDAETAVWRPILDWIVAHR